MWFSLLRRAELNRLNTYTFLTPVFGLIIGMLFYGERLSPLEWGGAALVILAAVVSSRHDAGSGAECPGQSRRTDVQVARMTTHRMNRSKPP